MNKYEAVIMFYPEVEEEKREASFTRIKNVMEEHGKINNIDEWGMRKLAYEIEYKQEAYYIFVEFECDPTEILEINRIARISDPVMRIMVIKVDE
ncbi:30S ribosomal protein S6 [Peptoniphilus raoultii]|uniref:30S ribosomal protein S6 n=1 Tax=Peptoniphilus raoultii TaxID=1776387 RepID=UPI0008DAADF0|nr:30S ribosomal protein S6 [Peptoniphilus raoultii]